MLHTVNKSPFERNSLESCLRMAKSGNAILLIEDGVYGDLKGSVMTDQIAAAMKNVDIYALKPDVDARGISEKVMDGVKLVGYDGFVDLASEYKSVQSWL